MSAIHPTAIVEPKARLGSGVRIGPYCVVGGDVELAENVELHSHVSIAGITRVGKETRIYPFASLGQPPQHLRYAGERVELVIGERNIIREYVTMNTGTPFGRGKTEVGNDGFFMTGSHVSHDSVLGNSVVFANNAVIGGHVVVGNNVMIGGNSAVHQFSRIGDHAFVGGMSGLENDLIPFGSCLGDRARLAGLNTVGLKRRGFTKDKIRTLRGAYLFLFTGEGTFAERLAEVERRYAAEPEVMQILAFINADRHRPLCLPRRGRAHQIAADASD